MLVQLYRSIIFHNTLKSFWNKMPFHSATVYFSNSSISPKILHAQTRWYKVNSIISERKSEKTKMTFRVGEAPWWRERDVQEIKRRQRIVGFQYKAPHRFSAFDFSWSKEWCNWEEDKAGELWRKLSDAVKKRENLGFLVAEARMWKCAGSGCGSLLGWRSWWWCVNERLWEDTWTTLAK